MTVSTTEQMLADSLETSLVFVRVLSLSNLAFNASHAVKRSCGKKAFLWFILHFVHLTIEEVSCLYPLKG